MANDDQKVAATCRVCGQQLTVAEFRACSGLGHHCAKHLPTASAGSRQRTVVRKPSGVGASPRGRSRRVSESGTIEYPCKAQFARDGVIRRGRLTSEHPACPEGGVLFVCNDVGYGPGEIATLFIKDRDGQALAERVGFECHE